MKKYNMDAISILIFSLILSFSIVYAFIDIRTLLASFIASFAMITIIICASFFFKRRIVSAMYIVSYLIGAIITAVLCRIFNVESFNAVLCSLIMPLGYLSFDYFTFELIMTTREQ